MKILNLPKTSAYAAHWHLSYVSRDHPPRPLARQMLPAFWTPASHLHLAAAVSVEHSQATCWWAKIPAQLFVHDPFLIVGVGGGVYVPSPPADPCPVCGCCRSWSASRRCIQSLGRCLPRTVRRRPKGVACWRFTMVTTMSQFTDRLKISMPFATPKTSKINDRCVCVCHHTGTVVWPPS